MTEQELKAYLDELVDTYNRPHFIESDPIGVPHRFSSLQNREIIGFWVAMLAWGQRKTIINKANALVELMDNDPYDFIKNHQEKDRQRFLHFKHRTFQAMDTLWFLERLQRFYREENTLETAFSKHILPTDEHVGKALIGFHDAFFDDALAPQRTRKHIATPVRKSTCKRLNMFLRWMVRKDDNGVDFGVWNRISPAQLLIPLDVHVDRVGRRLGLIERKQTDWKTVLELTQRLKKLDANDPVKYDFALFGSGVLEKQMKR